MHLFCGSFSSSSNLFIFPYPSRVAPKSSGLFWQNINSQTLLHQEWETRANGTRKLAQFKSYKSVTKPNTIKLFNTLHVKHSQQNNTVQYKTTLWNNWLMIWLLCCSFTVVTDENRFKSFGFPSVKMLIGERMNNLWSNYFEHRKMEAENGEGKKWLINFETLN